MRTGTEHISAKFAASPKRASIAPPNLASHAALSGTARSSIRNPVVPVSRTMPSPPLLPKCSETSGCPRMFASRLASVRS